MASLVPSEQPSLIVFGIPELAYLICATLPKHDNARLMRVCRQLFYSIAPYVWSEVEEANPLVSLIPGGGTVTYDSDVSPYVVMYLPDSLELSRFNLYAPHVKRLTPSALYVDEYHGWEGFLACTQSIDLLPNLEALYLPASDHTRTSMRHYGTNSSNIDVNSINWVIAFLPSSLRTLVLASPDFKGNFWNSPWMETDLANDLLGYVSQKCPGLHSLNALFTKARPRDPRSPPSLRPALQILSSDDSPEIHSSLRQFNSLTSLMVSSVILRHEPLIALSSLPHLAYLCVVGFDSDQTVYCNDLQIPTGSFPALKNLELSRLTFGTITNLCNASLVAKLQSMTLSDPYYLGGDFDQAPAIGLTDVIRLLATNNAPISTLIVRNVRSRYPTLKVTESWGRLPLVNLHLGWHVIDSSGVHGLCSILSRLPLLENLKLSMSEKPIELDQFRRIIELFPRLRHIQIPVKWESIADLRASDFTPCRSQSSAPLCIKSNFYIPEPQQEYAERLARYLSISRPTAPIVCESYQSYFYRYNQNDLVCAWVDEGPKDMINVELSALRFKSAGRLFQRPVASDQHAPATITLCAHVLFKLLLPYYWFYVAQLILLLVLALPMSVTPHPPRSSPAVTQSMPAQDTSFANSDRSLRSMHSAPSLTSAGSTSFASSVLSTSTLNLNAHSIPRRHPHLHIVDESADQHDQQHDDDKENLHASFAPPPNITITTSPERPQLKRMQSEKTVAGSLRLPRQSQGSLDSDAHLSWRASEYGVLDAYEEDEVIGSDADSVSGSTDELRRTLFYRPSTDPIQVRFQSEDRELEEALSAGSTSNMSLPQLPELPAGDLSTRPVPPVGYESEPQPESKPSSPPSRPARPPSLNLSDTQEPTPAPKTVDVDAVRRRSMQQAQSHSRKSSRDRLSMLLGLNSATPRASFQGGRLSFQAHNPSQSHSSNDTGKSQLENRGDAVWKGKERMVESDSPISETWIDVGASSATELSSGVGMRSALELGSGRDVGASSAIDLATSASGSRPRARTFSTHSRARTISSTHSRDAAEMCRSVWEDDTEDFGKGWGLVKRWLGDDIAGSSSTPTQKKRHVPKSLSLASTINAFRTPTSITSTINAFRTPTTMSPLFGEGGLMGAGPGNASFATAKESMSSAVSEDGYATPRSAVTTQETGTSRLSFHSFSNTSKRTSRSGLRSVSGGSNENGERTPASLTVPAPYNGRPSSRTSIQTSSDGHSAPEPESPTVTAKRLRPRSGTLEVPEVPIKSSRALFTEPGSSLRLELKPGTSKPGQQDFLRPGTHTPSALPSPPSSPEDHVQYAQTSSFRPAATSTMRGRPPVPRSLNNNKFGSLHGRLGSPLRSGANGEEGWAPMSPFMSPHSSPQAAGPPSPGWSPISPLPSSPLRTPASPLLSPTGSPLPLGMGIPMDHLYRPDVRPISGYTESSYWPSMSKRDSSATGGTGWKRDSATTAKRESDGTFAGRHSITHRPLLAPPPRTKTVRIVEAGPSTEARVKSIRETRTTFPPMHPLVSIPAPHTSAIFKVRPGSGAQTGARMRVKRKEAIGAGPSARAWFLIGFILGPWCWVIGGWVVQQGRPMATLDVEKGGRPSEGAEWVKRCRIASVVSGAVVFSGALVAVVWAAIGAR